MMTADHKGKLLVPRQGDLAEYLGQYFLSRFSYVTPIPRQEDFGLADFICHLGKKCPPYIYAENVFFVQVKSGKQPVSFKEDSTTFLTKHSEIPLLILLIDLEKDTFKLYSTWRLWYYLTLLNVDKINKITLKPDKYVINKKTPYSLSNKGTLTVPLWKPIVEMEKDNIKVGTNNIYEVLKYWLRIESLNLVALRTHKTYCYGLKEWEPNILPSETNFETYYRSGRKYFHQLAECLTSFCHDLDEQANKESIKSVSNVMNLIPEEFFNNFGKKFRNIK